MKTIFLFLIILGAALRPPSAHAATVRIWEQVPYLGASDSPFFQGIQAGTIFLEDFEDQQLNTPYVTSWDYPRIQGEQDGWVVASDQRGSSFRALGNTLGVFSVDADDGLNDGYLGLLGNTWTAVNVYQGGVNDSMEFRFQRIERHAEGICDSVPIRLPLDGFRNQLDHHDERD